MLRFNPFMHLNNLNVLIIIKISKYQNIKRMRTYEKKN